MGLWATQTIARRYVALQVTEGGVRAETWPTSTRSIPHSRRNVEPETPSSVLHGPGNQRRELRPEKMQSFQETILLTRYQ